MPALDEATAGPRRAIPGLALGLIVLIGTMALFAYDLDSEPLFVDEAAYLSQAYFGDLFFTGRWDAPLWLEYPSYDLPPLPKYFINISLRLHGIRRPAREWAIAWYRNTHEARFVAPESLHAARLPSVILGSLGCVAIYAIGSLAFGRRAGLIAASLLALNPLYRLHSRRAMSDVPAESLILLTLLAGFVLMRICIERRTRAGRRPILVILTGTLGGLAVLAKLNGGLGLIVVWAWLALAAVSMPIRWRDRTAWLLLAASIGAVSLGVFVGLNPFVSARPRNLGGVPLMAPVAPNQSISARLKQVVSHRVEVSRVAKAAFPRDALTTPTAKLSVLFVQGFGRFGPLGPPHSDSTRRYDLRQDWGAILWLPLVVAGLFRCVHTGREKLASGQFPDSWAVAVLFLVCMLTVGTFLPLAWDRYFLSIQAGSVLLASSAIVGVMDVLKYRRGTR